MEKASANPIIQVSKLVHWEPNLPEMMPQKIAHHITAYSTATSPPAELVMARQVPNKIELETNRTLPSHMPELTPLGCQLRAPIVTGLLAGLGAIQGGFDNSFLQYFEL